MCNLRRMELHSEYKGEQEIVQIVVRASAEPLKLKLSYVGRNQGGSYKIGIA